jgi:hypothetical protein
MKLQVHIAINADAPVYTLTHNTIVDRACGIMVGQNFKLI